jgi:hypothetical protein
MVPEDFFFATAMYAIAIFLSGLIIIGILAELVKRKLRSQVVD